MYDPNDQALQSTFLQGAIVGMLVGHTVTIWVCVGAGLLGRKSPTLPYSIDGCTDEIWAQVGNKTEFLSMQNMTSTPVPPELYVEIYTI